MCPQNSKYIILFFIRFLKSNANNNTFESIFFSLKTKEFDSNFLTLKVYIFTIGHNALIITMPITIEYKYSWKKI